MKILITGAKSATALKVLKVFEQNKVILADYGDVPSFHSNHYEIISLGALNEEVLAHNLLSKALDRGVDYILPLHHFEMEPLAKANVLFNEFNISLLIPSIEQLPYYLKEDLVQVKRDLAVFNKGLLVYSTIVDNEELMNYGQRNNLNGAFYFHQESSDFQSQLVIV